MKIAHISFVFSKFNQTFRRFCILTQNFDFELGCQGLGCPHQHTPDQVYGIFLQNIPEIFQRYPELLHHAVGIAIRDASAIDPQLAGNLDYVHSMLSNEDVLIEARELRDSETREVDENNDKFKSYQNHQISSKNIFKLFRLP